MKSYKICIVLDDSLDRNDGVQQYVRTLGSWLENNGHQVDYLVGETKDNKVNIISLARNISVQFNGNKLSIPVSADSKKIKHLLNSKLYDIIHIQMPYNPILAGKVIKHAPKSSSIVGTFHILPYGRLQQIGSKVLGSVQQKSLQKINQVITVSQPAKDFAKTIFGLNAVVLPNAIKLNDFRNNINNVDGRIIFLGRLVRRKGCEQLLRAYATLPKSVSDHSELIIAGDGPLRSKLEKLSLDLKLQNVKFIGFISEEEKVSLLASSQIAIFPSLAGESFGIVLLEAMAAGAGIVIGGDNPGYRSVLNRWPSVLIDPDNTQQFSRMLSDILTNKMNTAKISREQSIEVKQYDIDLVGPKIVDIYRQAIAINTKAKHNN